MVRKKIATIKNTSKNSIDLVVCVLKEEKSQVYLFFFYNFVIIITFNFVVHGVLNPADDNWLTYQRVVKSCCHINEDAKKEKPK